RLLILSPELECGLLAQRQRQLVGKLLDLIPFLLDVGFSRQDISGPNGLETARAEHGLGRRFPGAEHGARGGCESECQTWNPRKPPSGHADGTCWVKCVVSRESPRVTAGSIIRSRGLWK